MIYDDLSLYDLRPIQSSSKDYVVEQGTDKFYFNLCGQTIGSCSADQSEIYAYKKTSDGKCTELTDLNVVKRKVLQSPDD